jgi:hypothetical protein
MLLSSFFQYLVQNIEFYVVQTQSRMQFLQNFKGTVALEQIGLKLVVGKEVKS